MNANNELRIELTLCVVPSLIACDFADILPNREKRFSFILNLEHLGKHSK